MSSIAVLCHAMHPFSEIYFLYQIAKVWHEGGHEVSVIYGPGEKIEADLIVNHVDLTQTPVEYMALLRQYPAGINQYVTDISKRFISRNLVRRNDGWDGPVIVKTNNNCGGWQEARLDGTVFSPQSAPKAVENYTIFESAKDVPEEVWLDRGYVVEQFLPERQGEFYCLRTWMFLGDRETNSLSLSREAVVKQANVIERVSVPEVPDDLRQRREELGFDFGKFDYILSDGEAILYDANRTPALGNFDPESIRPRIEHLAEGLASLLNVKHSL